MKIRWTPTAARHLKAIQDYIAKDNPAAAYRVAQTIRQHVERLAQHPYAGRTGRVAGTRELVISRLPYIAAYAVSGDQVAILAVLHDAQQWPETFEESLTSGS